MALAAYRHVLRSTRIAFQGDLPTMSKARLEARTQFEKSRHLSSDSKEATQEIQKAEGVAQMLRANVVQGVALQEGADIHRYKLRIHEETEKGDNETVKSTLAKKKRL